MEHTNKISEERIRIAMVIGIYLAIILLLVTVVVLVKNVKEIKTDPIAYGIEKKGFEVCTCYAKGGLSYDYDENGVIRPGIGWNYNLGD